jgi:hypothetical protein
LSVFPPVEAFSVPTDTQEQHTFGRWFAIVIVDGWLDLDEPTTCIGAGKRSDENSVATDLA